MQNPEQKKPFARGVEWLAALVTGLAAAQPLFAGTLPRGADMLLHYHRIVALSELIQSGVPYSRWFPFLAAGYGYPILEYYAPLAHYIGAGFHVLGFGLEHATLMVFALALALASAGMYAWARERVSGAGALCAAAAYAFAPYLLIDMTGRSALAELLALGFAPWVFAAQTRSLTRGRWQDALLGVFALAGLILSHNITALVFAPFVAAWSLAQAFGRKGGLWRAIWPMALGLGVSAFFWLPAFLEKDQSQLDAALSAAYDFRAAFVPLASLVALPARFDFLLVNDTAQYGLGLPALVLAALGGVVWLRQSKPRAFMWPGFALFGALFGAAMTSQVSLPLWESIPILRFVLYPTRFLGMASMFVALLAGAGAGWLARGRMGSGLAGAAILILAVYGFGWQFARRYPSNLPTGGAAIAQAERTLGIIGTTSIGEYLPRAAQTLPEQNSPALARGGGVLLPADGLSVNQEIVRPLEYDAVVSATRAVSVSFSQFYFPGWVTWVDGIEARITPSAPHGLVSFQLPIGQHRIQVKFLETPLRLAADALSVLSLVLCFAVVFFARGGSPRLAQPAPAAFSIPLMAGLAILALVKTAWVDQTQNIFRGTRLNAPYVAGAQNVNANFAGALELMAADPPRFSADRAALEVDLFWRKLRKDDMADYSVFTQLVDANGVSIAALDTSHPDGVYPTSRWDVTEYTRDTRRMSLPAHTPPGQYVLMAGVYLRGQADQRLAVLGADGRPVGASFAASLARVMTITVPALPAQNASVLPKPAQDVRAPLSDAVSMVGVDPAFSNLQAGAAFVLPVYWQASQIPVKEELVCFDLTGADAVYELGCWPLVAGWPLTQWRAGDVWRSSFAFRVPRAALGGAYTLEARLGAGPRAALLSTRINAPTHQMLQPDVGAYQPLNESLGDFARLSGYAMPRRATPGQKITLALVWRGVAETHSGYIVFAHVLDSSGQRKAGVDALPAQGIHPTEGWLAGEYITDAREIEIPADAPPGEYHIAVGMYDAETQRRAQFANGADALVLPGALVVESK